MYLTLAYFYFIDNKLKATEFPTRFTLFIFQLFGILFIICDFYVCKFFTLSDSYMFYHDNKENIDLLHIINLIVGLVVLVISSILMFIYREDNKKYTTINEEIKNA